MKGVILAGGNGTRLRPLTQTTNKHLLPIFNKQMIFYPLQTLLDANIKDILIISGREHAGHFIELLGSGSQFNANFTYKVQDKAGGIAEALGLAEDFIKSSFSGTIMPFAVILGDNIFGDKLNLDLKKDKQAKVFLKKVSNASRFGVPKLDYNGNIEFIVEKPKGENSGLAVTGTYVYYSDVFEVINRLKPSARGELEITDVNNYYAKLGTLEHNTLEGFWSDAGTFESLTKSTLWASKQ